MLLYSSMALDENIFFLAAFLCRNLPLAVCNSCSVTINSSWIALCWACAINNQPTLQMCCRKHCLVGTKCYWALTVAWASPFNDITGICINNALPISNNALPIAPFCSKSEITQQLTLIEVEHDIMKRDKHEPRF